MSAAVVTVRLEGGVAVKVRRLTLKEIRAARVSFQAGKDLLDPEYDALVREHVTRDDGQPLDPEELTLSDLQKVVVEMAGIPEGSGIADFIGLLC